MAVELKLEWLSNCPPAMFDTEQIKRVFVNLTDNALEALLSVSDRRVIRIATRHDPTAKYCWLRLRTLEKESRRRFQRLFQPYFSTKERGTGLGLAIVERIITEHRGPFTRS